MGLEIEHGLIFEFTWGKSNSQSSPLNAFAPNIKRSSEEQKHNNQQFNKKSNQIYNYLILSTLEA
jgi:hypothetical protein